MSFEKLTLQQRLNACNIDVMRHPQFALLASIVMMGKSVVLTADEYAVVESMDKDGKVAGSAQVKVPTAMTNGRDKYYGADFIKDQSRKQLRYLVLHENAHVAFKHLITREYRKWILKFGGPVNNIAMDYVVNAFIEELDPKFEFVERPTNIAPLVDPKYFGMSYPQVLQDLLRQAKEQSKDGKGKDGKGKGGGGIPVYGLGDGEPQEIDVDGQPMDDHQLGTPEKKVKGPSGKEVTEGELIDRQIDDALRQGQMLVNKLAGKERGGRDVFGLMKERTTDWKTPLQDFITSVCTGDDNSRFCPPNKRMLGAGIIMPSHFSETIGELLLAPDTSGSMHPHYPVLFGEVARIIQQVKPESVRVLWWDTAVCADQQFKPDQYEDIAKLLSPKGGGGTTPQVVVDYMAEHQIKPKAIVWLSDGYLGCSDPATPGVPALWGIIGNDSFVPMHGKLLHIQL